MRNCLLVLLAFVVIGCGKTPPTLSPTGGRYYQADRGVVAIGTIQRVAIQLNGVNVCEPTVLPAVPKPCHPMLSKANTTIVVDAATDALKTMKVAPQGWKVIVSTTLTIIADRLDTAGKTELAAYLDAARQIVASF